MQPGEDAYISTQILLPNRDPDFGILRTGGSGSGPCGQLGETHGRRRLPRQDPAAGQNGAQRIEIIFQPHRVARQIDLNVFLRSAEIVMKSGLFQEKCPITAEISAHSGVVR